MTPYVSVIVPVYNSVHYIKDALRSVQEQTLEPELLEIIAVDDGSTDGSGEVLREMAAEDPRITVISQENSGTPGGGRNPAIGRARGEFVFFLDSDDLLTPEALRLMVQAAHDGDADVVLGRIGSMDARRPPMSMFARSVEDADLIEDRVFNTLGPTKLIRRSLIEDLGLRFPEDQASGEDQPFMAAVYLNARKISILADQDYYLIRHREDGSNMTRRVRSPEEHLRTAVRLSSVIEQYTEPGERRDALLRRPFTWSMSRVLGGLWLELSAAEKEALAETFRSELAHLYTDGVRQLVSEEMRWKLDLLAAGDLRGTTLAVEHFSSSPERRIVWRDGAFQRKLPAEIESLLPQGSREAAPPKMTTRLEEVRVEEQTVAVTASVKIVDFDGAPEKLGIRARHRHSGTAEDLPVTSADLSPQAPTFLVSAEHSDWERGIWDLFVVVTFGEFEKELRLGADRARSVEPEGASNFAAEPAPRDQLVAYFTDGPGNLSIDRGGLIQRNTARARSVGLTVDENGRMMMLVQTVGLPKESDEYFCYLEGVPQHGGRHLLPSVRLGERLLGLRLPITSEMVGATVRVVAALDRVRTPLSFAGAEFWSARATGFAVVPDAEGTATIVGPGARPRARAATQQFSPRTRAPQSGMRTRAATVVKAIPVAGPALTRAVRAVRGWRR